MCKLFVSFCMAGVIAAFSSCASTKYVTVPVEAIDGEWNIVEIEGTAVVPAPGQEFPYIAFDVESGKVSGNAGCNRIIGSFDVHAKPGVIDLSALGTTRMMCPDMTVERNVLAALGKVKKYRKLEDGSIALCISSRHPALILQKRKAAAVTLESLEGKWMIQEAAGEAIPDTLENRPFIEFNVAERKVHGQTGCNLMNGGFQTDAAKATSISFPQLAATMMACPDMAVESRVLGALNAVRSFGRLANGNMGPYDETGALMLVLVKE